MLDEMTIRDTADKKSYKCMVAEELREAFLVDDLFQPGKLTLMLTDTDRAVIGSAVPVDSPLPLPSHKALSADYFTERRELGIINIGARGSVTVNGKSYKLESRDSLYIGLGNETIEFTSYDPDELAKFYFLSYPAHKKYKTRLVKADEAHRVELGSDEECNKRVIYQSICPGIVDSCQIVMGFTELMEGSNWNTFPPHSHRRRSEIYMYFDLDADARVFHFMGEPDETRSIVIKDGEAVISPSWSVHCGVGSRNYRFVWGMGGENQQFTDMDHIKIEDIR